MTENFRSTIALVLDATGPALSEGIADGYAQANLVTVSRRVRTSASRRNPHRAVVEAVIPVSSYSLRHDWDLTTDLTNLRRVIEGVADAGRGEAISGGMRWRIGRSNADPVRFHCILAGVDGAHYEARSCIFVDWTLTAERRSAVRCETMLNARALTTDDSAPELAVVPGAGRGVSPLDIAYSINGDSTGGLFSLVIGFQRQAEAAGLDEEGTASAWAGSLTPDIAGRMVCRVALNVFDQAFRDEMRGGLTFSFVIGTATMVIDIPTAIMKASTRTHIDGNLYEYVVDFAAIQQENEDAATIELTS